MGIMRSYPSFMTESDTQKTPSTSRKITKKLDLLDRKLDGLYRDIYVSRPDNRQNMDTIVDKLDQGIDDLLSNDVSISGMSELIRRLDNDSKSDTDKLFASVGEIFGNQNIIDNLTAYQDTHKYILAQNYQYDLICKYLPKLLDALEIKRDNVLCSDNFAKEFLNPKSNKSSKSKALTFAANAKRLEKEYDLSNFLEKTYMNCSKYGEDFIYIVPYREAFERLLKRNKNLNNSNARLGSMSFYGEAAGTRKGNHEKVDLLTESYTDRTDWKEAVSAAGIPFEGKFKGSPVTVWFNPSGVVDESVNEMVVFNNAASKDAFRGLGAIAEATRAKNGLEAAVAKQHKNFESNDGLIIPEELSKDAKIDKHMTGAVLERLPRENVIPVYIGKKCLGYLYIQFRENEKACGFCGSNAHSVPGVSNANKYAYDMAEQDQDLVIRYIAAKLSQQIDAKFINANKDLKEEIYAILRYNEKFDITRSNDIGVTFIPADDMIHCYFEMDEDTHRGISDLAKSVVPAMLYILLYLTDIIGKITRSNDKRIYYVKQNVETNVARTMMNVVAQIKKGNMGMRQLESMNNILNIVGKYNDYIIPMGQSGDPPIQFEVMNGQDIQTPTDIMEKQEEAAINATGVPFELVNATYQQDFAIRFSMSNTRLLKHIYTRQHKTQRFFSEIYTKVYNYEFDESNSLIEIILPPPIYLAMNNSQQLFDNITQQADKLIENEMSTEDDEIKSEFKRLYIRAHLSTYIDYVSIERMIETAKVNVESRKNPQVEEAPEGESDEDMGEYM